MKRLIIIAMIFISIPCYAKRIHHERWYQLLWCADHGGKTEVVLPDKSRCDCLTDTNAIEFDFSEKWQEAIGQSLYYGLQTGKRPGIVLIVESPNDHRYWIRLNTTIQHYHLPIDTWIIN